MDQSSSNTIKRHEQATGTASNPYAASMTVLLVDDEPMVRRMVREILALEGYQVLEAAGPGEALRHCERHQGPIHLLLTDVQMPGMDGCRLASLIVAAREETKVLLMSGYADNAVLRHGIETLRAAYIRKPFLPDNLLDTVRTVLEVSVTAPA
jgi:CheY-like chemotaxis protein